MAQTVPARPRPSTGDALVIKLPRRRARSTTPTPTPEQLSAWWIEGFDCWYLTDDGRTVPASRGEMPCDRVVTAIAPAEEPTVDQLAAEVESKRADASLFGVLTSTLRKAVQAARDELRQGDASEEARQAMAPRLGLLEQQLLGLEAECERREEWLSAAEDRLARAESGEAWPAADHDRFSGHDEVFG